MSSGPVFGNVPRRRLGPTQGKPKCATTPSWLEYVRDRRGASGDYSDGGATKGKRMIETKVEKILVRVSGDDPTKLAWFGRIIILKEKDGGQVLPIWSGPPEADLLYMSLQGKSTP